MPCPTGNLSVAGTTLSVPSLLVPSQAHPHQTQTPRGLTLDHIPCSHWPQEAAEHLKCD